MSIAHILAPYKFMHKRISYFRLLCPDVDEVTAPGVLFSRCRILAHVMFVTIFALIGFDVNSHRMACGESVRSSILDALRVSLNLPVPMAEPTTEGRVRVTGFGRFTCHVGYINCLNRYSKLYSILPSCSILGAWGSPSPNG